MANPHRGEATLPVDGVDYKLVFDTNNLCEVEDLLGLTITQILGQLEGLRTVRALVWGGLRTHHPEVDILQAGRIVETIGGAGPALEVLGRALTAAMPEAKEGDGSRPQTGAVAGTGQRSKGRGSKRA